MACEVELIVDVCAWERMKSKATVADQVPTLRGVHDEKIEIAVNNVHTDRMNSRAAVHACRR